MTANFEIRLLGGLQIIQNSLAVAGFTSSKVPALLAYLAVTGRPHQRDALAGLARLGLYRAATAGVIGGDNATVRLDYENGHGSSWAEIIFTLFYAA